MDKRDILLEYILNNADKDWIYDFIYNVLEVDWARQLRRYPNESLEKWARELGYINPSEDY